MANKYYVILVNGQPMQPKGGAPYVFGTKRDALKCKWNCYGACKDVVVVKQKINPVIPSKIKTT